MEKIRLNTEFHQTPSNIEKSRAKNILKTLRNYKNKVLQVQTSNFYTPTCLSIFDQELDGRDAHKLLYTVKLCYNNSKDQMEKSSKLGIVISRMS